MGQTARLVAAAAEIQAALAAAREIALMILSSGRGDNCLAELRMLAVNKGELVDDVVAGIQVRAAKSKLLTLRHDEIAVMGVAVDLVESISLYIRRRSDDFVASVH